MAVSTELLTIFKTMQDRHYLRNTHQKILEHMAISKTNGNNIQPQVLKILQETENEEEVLKKVLSL